ncbi:hybrid sensor histidine kinase/response regulator [Arsenicibacter rosenii]|uniref:histidine kinase n=1 Tax=Arsenicibacter rosenii TaxID=1750698 RepID=A0A1S2VPN2_9BACT|nr:response regulator [Arsenicibacter rosenii]OIN60719.1 hypothetical protein BLX24_01005 [Arsenicibacter rosenii]
MNERILIIEDEPPIRDNIAELLTIYGFEVYTAQNGREGISQALITSPDLVLCDIMMPEMDGYQVLNALRDTRSLSGIPFIFLTARAEASDFRSGMNAGADDYLTKPFTINDLLQTIDRRLKRDAQRKADIQARLSAYRESITSISSHEYNTPLSGIIGFADLLSTNFRDFDPESSVSMLHMIKQSALRLKRSLDNNRLMSILEHMHPAHEHYAWYSTGQSSLTEEKVVCQLEDAMERQDIHPESKVTVQPGCLAIAGEHLKLIIDELIDNAVKFTTGNKPVLIQGSITGERYTLSCTNTGRVFRQQDIDRIGPYVQFDRDKYEQQGLGLGLALIKKILSFNRGELEVNASETGETQVAVSLPVCQTGLPR